MKNGRRPAATGRIFDILLAFESSNQELFDFLHNVLHKKSKQLEHRLQCLQWLKECGYQVGTGVMITFGTALEDLCSDIRLYQKLEADMIGMGPYLMSEGGDLKSLGQTENKKLFQLSLNMIAVTRLVMGNINIAAATAMQVLDPQGRETAISYGANVVMPNLTPLQYREGYQLYDKKPGLRDDPETFGLKLKNAFNRKAERSAGIFPDRRESGSTAPAIHRKATTAKRVPASSPWCGLNPPSRKTTSKIRYLVSTTEYWSLSMRRSLVIANWKMNGSVDFIDQ